MPGKQPPPPPAAAQAKHSALSGVMKCATKLGKDSRTKWNDGEMLCMLGSESGILSWLNPSRAMEDMDIILRRKGYTFYAKKHDGIKKRFGRSSTTRRSNWRGGIVAYWVVDQVSILLYDENVMQIGILFRTMSSSSMKKFHLKTLRTSSKELKVGLLNPTLSLPHFPRIEMSII